MQKNNSNVINVKHKYSKNAKFNQALTLLKAQQFNEAHELIRQMPDVNLQDSTQRTLLHVIICTCSAESLGQVLPIVKTLIEKKTNLDLRDNGWLTALYRAFQYNLNEIAPLLIDAGADINTQDAQAKSLLHMLISNQRPIETLIALIEYPQLNINIKDNNHLTPLHYALHCNKNSSNEKTISILKILLARGADINAKDSFGTPLLHRAVTENSIEIIEFLIQNGADIEAKDAIYRTALNYVVQDEKENLVELFIRHGANVNTRSSDERSPLHNAADTNNINIVTALINAGADIEAKDRDGRTAVFFTIPKGRIEIMKLLVEKGAKTNIQDKQKATPLIIAAEYVHPTSTKKTEPSGKISILEFLLQSGENAGKNEALYCATHPIAISLLAAYGANLNICDERELTPLHVFAKENQLALIKALLDAGADPNIQSYNGLTPLHLATNSEDIESMRLLINAGANINALNDAGLTPFHCGFAIQNNEEVMTQAIELFINNKVDVNLQAYQPVNENMKKTQIRPFSALSYFIDKGDLKHTMLLVQQGANINLLQGNGLTPFHHAMIYGSIPIIAFLLTQPVDIHAMDEDGEMPIHHAVKHQDTPQVIEMLLDKNANIDAKTHPHGLTALHIAVENQNIEMVRFLVMKGAKLNIGGKIKSAKVEMENVSPLELAVILKADRCFDILFPLFLSKKSEPSFRHYIELATNRALKQNNSHAMAAFLLKKPYFSSECKFILSRKMKEICLVLPEMMTEQNSFLSVLSINDSLLLNIKGEDEFLILDNRLFNRNEIFDSLKMRFNKIFDNPEEIKTIDSMSEEEVCLLNEYTQNQNNKLFFYFPKKHTYYVSKTAWEFNFNNVTDIQSIEKSALTEIIRNLEKSEKDFNDEFSSINAFLKQINKMISSTIKSNNQYKINFNKNYKILFGAVFSKLCEIIKIESENILIKEISEKINSYKKLANKLVDANPGFIKEKNIKNKACSNTLIIETRKNIDQIAEKTTEIKKLKDEYNTFYMEFLKSLSNEKIEILDEIHKNEIVLIQNEDENIIEDKTNHVLSTVPEIEEKKIENILILEEQTNAEKLKNILDHCDKKTTESLKKYLNKLFSYLNAPEQNILENDEILLPAVMHKFFKFLNLMSYIVHKTDESLSVNNENIRHFWELRNLYRHYNSYGDYAHFKENGDHKLFFKKLYEVLLPFKNYFNDGKPFLEADIQIESKWLDLDSGGVIYENKKIPNFTLNEHATNTFFSAMQQLKKGKQLREQARSSFFLTPCLTDSIKMMLLLITDSVRILKSTYFLEYKEKISLLDPELVKNNNTYLEYYTSHFVAHDTKQNMTAEFINRKKSDLNVILDNIEKYETFFVGVFNLSNKLKCDDNIINTGHNIHLITKQEKTMPQEKEPLGNRFRFLHTPLHRSPGGSNSSLNEEEEMNRSSSEEEINPDNIITLYDRDESNELHLERLKISTPSENNYHSSLSRFDI